MRVRSCLPILLGLSSLACGQTQWGLSGKIVDAEEGNGLNAVEVSLAQAGLKTTSAKNGDWTLGSVVGVQGRGPHRESASENFLRMVEGRLLLRMGGIDIRGRHLGNAPSTLPASIAARAMATVSDTLVYSRDGFVTKRVPLSTSSLTGIRDSLRRIRYEGWVDSSHSNGFKPDTTDAFVDTLRKITLRFSKRDWDSLMKAMTDSCGKFGGGRTNCSPDQYDLIENSALIWVPGDLLADGQVWKNVALRLKGNASLQTAWQKGSYSLPFRINTDKFEDTYPTTKNQRFHGFKKLSFYNSEQDSTSIRGPIASEIFRRAGVVTPITVPVQLFLDRGDGTPIDLGPYEMVEVPDNPLLNRYFGHDSGNLYKPSSKLDKFVQSEFENEDIKGDYSDVKALINAINATNRTSDSAAWHRSLEKLLDVDGFLNWLAVSTAIVNWDAYGGLAHNYFMFNDSGTFKWITYDFGWSFDYSMLQIVGQNRTSIWYDGTGGFMSFGPYPLVKNLLADKTYCETYRKHMVAAVANGGPASDATFKMLVDRYGGMVSGIPKTVNPVKNLRNFMATRVPEIEKSLSSKTCPIPAK